MGAVKKIILLLCLAYSSAYADTIVCFTPGQDCEALFAATIDKAKRTLDIQEYHLTSKKIVAAVLRAKGRGVVTRIILDKTARKEAAPFINADISVSIDDRVRIAHNKVMIIDGDIVIGGSYNPTESAQKRNAENLRIDDNRVLGVEYEGNFMKRLHLSFLLSEL